MGQDGSVSDQEELSQQLFDRRVDLALREVFDDMEQRDALIEERKQVYVQTLLQRQLVEMIDRKAA